MNRIFYLYIFLIFTKSICAQHTMGLVFGIDDKAKKEALPGANVYWLGTTIGSLTNQTGFFQIPNPEKTPSKLIVSMVGFVSDTITINSKDQKDLRVVLQNQINLNVVEVTETQMTTMNKIYTPINMEVIGSKELLKAACCNLSESFSTNASVDVAFTDAVSGAKKIQMLGLD